MSELSGKEEASRARWPNYWLLVEHETSSMHVLAVDLNGGGSPSGRPKEGFQDRSNVTRCQRRLFKRY